MQAEDAEEQVELLHGLEAGMARGAPARPPPRSSHNRNPLLFWRVVSALLLAALAALRAS